MSAQRQEQLQLKALAWEPSSLVQALEQVREQASVPEQESVRKQAPAWALE